MLRLRAEIGRVNFGMNGENPVLDIDPSSVPTERYRPLEIIGQGALGRVYLCMDKHLGKTVAVKTLLSVTDDRVVSFQNEARIASRLGHESIIQILDFGVTDGGRPFMVMEYFPSQSLADVLAAEGRLPERDALELFVMITDALSCLHENGVFHRDLKPSNILIGSNDQKQLSLRLIDFNLSKTSQDIQSKTIVQGRTVVGTPAYMSPDQVAGQKYDSRSEVYSMGCLMYEVITGRPPFLGDTALDVLNKHANEKLTTPQQLAPELSDRLNDIIERCLSKKRDARYATMSELLAELKSCVSDDSRDTAGSILSVRASSSHTNFKGKFIEANSKLSQELSREFQNYQAPKSSISKLTVVGVVAGLVLVSFAIWGVTSLLKPPESPRISYLPDSIDANPMTGGLTAELSDGKRVAESAVKNKTAKVKLPYSCTDEDLKVLEGNINIQEIAVSDSLSLSDKCFKSFATLPNLKRLELDGTGVDTLAGVNECANLELLSLNRTAITDESAKNLKGLDKLFWLRICKTDITDKFLANLPELPRLTDVSFGGQSLTDACIPDLLRQKHLAYINIGNTAITPGGVRKLVSGLKYVMAVDTKDNPKFDLAEITKLTREFPKVDFDPSASMRNLSGVELKAEELYKDGNFKDALSLYKRCIRLQNGNAKIRIVNYQGRIADCYEKLGDWHQALRMLESYATTAESEGVETSAIVLYDSAKKLAQRHHDTASSIKYSTALHRIFRDRFGQNAADTFYSAIALGDLHASIKNYTKAESYYIEASKIATHKRRREDGHYQIIPLVRRAEIYRTQGRIDEARRLIKQSLELSRKQLRITPTNEVRQLFFVAAAAEVQILHDQLKLDDALKLNTEAIDVVTSVANPKNDQLFILIRQRASIMKQLHRDKEATELKIQAAKLAQSSNAPSETTPTKPKQTQK